MRVLIIGSGAREHALAWRLAQDELVSQVYVAPGNGGTHGNKIMNLPANSINAWLAAAKKIGADLTVVGPEQPLVMGIADVFQQHALPLLGPTAAAARIEGSKLFAKSFMQRHGIPTPEYRVIYNLHDCRKCIDEWESPYVIKPDGLSGGKGVAVTHSREEAIAVVSMLLEGLYSAASTRLLIERYIHGIEVSLCMLCDGTHAISLGTARDYKRLRNNDEGPNTGGMGSYSPSLLELHGELDVKALEAKFVIPLLKGMVARGTPYRGFLYPSLIIADDGQVFCLEYNCRMGDPEAQVLVPRWEGDIILSFLAAARGRLTENMLQINDECSVGVVLATAGYPLLSRSSGWVSLPVMTNRELVFHGSTSKQDDGTVTVNGGRVATLTAVRSTIQQATSAAYAMVSLTVLEDGQFRNDIGLTA